MLRALTLAAFALALVGSAHAHDYSADMICRVTETDGQRSAWSFAPNTTSVDGSPVSTPCKVRPEFFWTFVCAKSESVLHLLTGRT
jgi:hypothetical protein